MKAFIPATLLALASATSACTFVYNSYSSGNDLSTCTFEVYMEDDLYGPSAGDEGTQSGFYSTGPCFNKAYEQDRCYSPTNKKLGDKYYFCIDGTVDEMGTVDGDMTIQREGGSILSIKRDGNEETRDNGVTYWRGGIDCPGAQPEGTADPSAPLTMTPTQA